MEETVVARNEDGRVIAGRVDELHPHRPTSSCTYGKGERARCVPQPGGKASRPRERTLQQRYHSSFCRPPCHHTARPVYCCGAEGQQRQRADRTPALSSSSTQYGNFKRNNLMCGTQYTNNVSEYPLTRRRGWTRSETSKVKTTAGECRTEGEGEGYAMQRRVGVIDPSRASI